jgi:hypothetical protein
MPSSIRDFWQRLASVVHPDDENILRSSDHSFNLDFPPPAYIGDIDNAPVVILMANGGYSPIETPREFRDQADIDEYVAWLKGDRVETPRNLSSYYKSQKVFHYVKPGKVAIANAVAYRSVKLSEEPENIALAAKLPSTKAHRNWLVDELIPTARAGKRLIIAHRWKFWGLSPGHPGVLFSTNQASPHLSKANTDKISEWLK